MNTKLQVVEKKLRLWNVKLICDDIFTKRIFILPRRCSRSRVAPSGVLFSWQEISAVWTQTGWWSAGLETGDNIISHQYHVAIILW